MHPVHLRSAGTSLLLAFDCGEAEIVHWGADLGEHLPDLAILRGPRPALRPRHPRPRRTAPAGLLRLGRAAGPARAPDRRRRPRPGLLAGPAGGCRPDAGRRAHGGDHPAGLRRRTRGQFRTHPARRRPAGAGSHRSPTAARADTSSTNWPRCSRWRRTPRTPRPHRTLVPRTPPAAARHPAGHLGPHRPARPHRPRLLAAVRRRHRRLRQPPRQGLGHAPGLERQPRAVRSTASRDGRHHDRRLRAARPRRSHPAPRRQLHRRRRSSPPTPTAAWTASARPSTAGSAPGRTTCCPTPTCRRRKPRPVVLNTWEAVYFDHNLDHPDRTRRLRRRARRGTLRARRRLVPRPPRRPRGPGRLVRRRGPVARRASRR